MNRGTSSINRHEHTFLFFLVILSTVASCWGQCALVRTCLPGETWDPVVCDCICNSFCDGRLCGLVLDSCSRVRDCDCAISGRFCNSSGLCETCSTPRCGTKQCSGTVSNRCGQSVTCAAVCNATTEICQNGFCTCIPPTCPAKQCSGYLTNPCGPPIPCANTCAGDETCVSDFCQPAVAPPVDPGCVTPTCPADQCGGFIENPCGAPIACGNACGGGFSCRNNTCQPDPPVCAPPTCPSNQCSGSVFNPCGPAVSCNNVCGGSDVCFDGFCCTPPLCPADQCGGFITNPCGFTALSCNKTCDPGFACINSRCQASCTRPTCPAEQCSGSITDPCGGPPVVCNGACTGGKTCINGWCEIPAPPGTCQEATCPPNQCGGLIASVCGGADVPCSRPCPDGANCDGQFCVFPPIAPPTPPAGALPPVFFPPPPSRQLPPSASICENSPVPPGASNPSCISGLRTYTVSPCHIYCPPAAPVEPPIDSPVDGPISPRVPVAIQPPVPGRTPSFFFRIPQLTTIKVNGFLDAPRVNFVGTASLTGALVGTIELLGCARVGGMIVIFLPASQIATGAVIDVFRSNRPSCFNETFPTYLQVSTADGQPIRDGCGKMVALKRIVNGPTTRTLQVTLAMDYSSCAPTVPTASSVSPSNAIAVVGGSTGAIIGGVVGGVVGLILIIAIVVVIVRRRGGSSSAGSKKSGGGSSTKSHEMSSVKSTTASQTKSTTTSVSQQPVQQTQTPTYTLPATNPTAAQRPYSQPQPVGFTPQTMTPAMNPRPATAAPTSVRAGGSIFTPAADVDLSNPSFPQPSSYVYYDDGQQGQQQQQQQYYQQDQQPPQQYYAGDPIAENSTDFQFQTFRSNKVNYGGNVSNNAGNTDSMYVGYN